MANPFDIFKQQMREKAEERKRLEELLRRVSDGMNTRQRVYSNPWDAQPWTKAAARPAPAPAWCKVLGLPPDATPAEIKSKYRQLALKHHPDKGGDAATFNKINEAYKQASR